MSTHNICLHGEIRKNVMWIPLLFDMLTFPEHSLHLLPGLLQKCFLYFFLF